MLNTLLRQVQVVLALFAITTKNYSTIPPSHNDVIKLGKKIFEFSEFMIKVLGVSNVGAKLEGKATYHDSCAGLRECKIKEEPTAIAYKT